MYTKQETIAVQINKQFNSCQIGARERYTIMLIYRQSIW